ncbi:MAG: hypothetical protein ACRCZF_13225 [Gemmataceae bacterium]
MGMENYTRYQQGIIKRYYAAADGLQLQKLSEYVTELYLAEGKKRQRVWKSIETLLTKLEVPAERIAHIVQSDDPKLVANLVTELSKKS